MDPTQLLIAALTLAGSSVAQKCADASIEAAWGRVTAAYRRWRGKEPSAEEIMGLSPDEMAHSDMVGEAESIIELSPALRRARLVPGVLRGARILWVDDHPENNAWERSLLTALGVEVLAVTTTSAALSIVDRERFDLVLSDIRRQEEPDEGVRALPLIREAAEGARLVFYIGELSSAVPPAGAFGITNDPHELLHLILDALERDRV